MEQPRLSSSYEEHHSFTRNGTAAGFDPSSKPPGTGGLSAGGYRWSATLLHQPPHGCCGWGKTLEKVSRHGNLFRQMAGRLLSIMTPPGGTPLFYLTKPGCPLPTHTLVLRVKNRGTPTPYPPVFTSEHGGRAPPPTPPDLCPQHGKNSMGTFIYTLRSVLPVILVI